MSFLKIHNVYRKYVSRTTERCIEEEKGSTDSRGNGYRPYQDGTYGTRQIGRLGKILPKLRSQVRHCEESIETRIILSPLFFIYKGFISQLSILIVIDFCLMGMDIQMFNNMELYR